MLADLAVKLFVVNPADISEPQNLELIPDVKITLQGGHHPFVQLRLVGIHFFIPNIHSFFPKAFTPMQLFLFGTFIFLPVSFEKIFRSALITQVPAPAIKLPLIVTWAVPLIQLSAMLYCKLISIEKKNLYQCGLSIRLSQNH